MINLGIRKIKIYFELILFKIKWRKLNAHNFTAVGNIFPINKVSVGEKTYGKLNVKTYGDDNESLRIGSYCSIAGDVKFLLGGEHSYKGLSTYPFKKFICKIDENTITKGPILIKDDVWIGESAIILSGVEIGQGAVIAAGSIVAKNVPPYAIYAGNEVKKYRFSEKVIQKLLGCNFGSLEDKVILNNIKMLYDEVDESNVDKIISIITDFSKELENE